MDWIFTGDGFEVVDGCFMAVVQGALGAESRLVRVRRLVTVADVKYPQSWPTKSRNRGWYLVTVADVKYLETMFTERQP